MSAGPERALPWSLWDSEAIGGVLRRRRRGVDPLPRRPWLPPHRLLTAPLRQDPDFLILGAMKAGTSSLFTCLTGHPEVARPFRKEIRYFDRHPLRPWFWYRAHFPLRGRTRRITGEASPFYLFHPAAPNRVARSLPQVRAIALLRDPVERAWSHFHHGRRLGFEPLARFEDAVAAEPRRIADALGRLNRHPWRSSFALRHYSYVARGRYAPQILRWQAALGAERVLLIESARLFSDPSAALGRVAEFLGIDPVGFPRLTAENVGRGPTLPPELRRALAPAFRDSDEALATLLGRPPAWSRAG